MVARLDSIMSYWVSGLILVCIGAIFFILELWMDNRNKKVELQKMKQQISLKSILSVCLIIYFYYFSIC